MITFLFFFFFNFYPSVLNFFRFGNFLPLCQVENTEAMWLSAKLQDCYNFRRPGLHLFCPTVGQACVVRVEDSWCRAQVTGEALRVSVC